MREWYKKLPDDHRLFCERWLVTRGENFAKTGQVAGVALYFITLLVTPLVGNPYNQTTMYRIFGSFLFAAFISIYVANRTGKYKRQHLYFFSIAYVGAIGYLVHIGKSLPVDYYAIEMVVAPAAFLLASTFLILSGPFYGLRLSVVTPLIHLAIGAIAIYGTSFGPRWLVLLGLSTFMSSLWQLVESRKGLKEAYREYLSQKQLSAALARESALKLGEGELQIKAMVLTSQMLAHDLRSPLTMFKAIVQVLQSADASSLHLLIKKSETQLENAIESMTSMINDIVDASAKPTIRELPVSLFDVWNESIRQVFCNFMQSSVQLNYDLKHTCHLNVDRQKTGRMLINLSKNAVEAMGGNGHINIRTEDLLVGERLFMKLTLNNPGIPIPPENLKTIFEVFQTRNKKKGVGLGLAIVKKFAEAHGGTIVCESDAENGTSFILTLPCDSTAIDQFEAAAYPTHSSEIISDWLFEHSPQAEANSLEVVERLLNLKVSGKPLNVLLVDDESIYMNMLKSYIEPLIKARSVNIFCAGSQEDAMNLANKIRFDAVICDIDLNNVHKDGFDTVSGIRGLESTAYICVHSNRLMPQDTEKSIQSGADVCIPKPMAKLQFLRILNAAVQKKDVA